MRLHAFIALILSALSVGATHLKGGYIRIEKTTGLTYRIIVSAFTDTNDTNVLFGGEDERLDFGDGTFTFIPQSAKAEVAEGVIIVRYEVLHTYSREDFYVVTYREPNRDANVVNMTGSVNTMFHIESAFTAETFTPYASPGFLTPVFSLDAGSEYRYGVTGKDQNNHTLIYYADAAQFSAGYEIPSGFRVNQFNGVVNWDGKFHGETRPGRYVFNVRVTQLRNGNVAGYIVIDFEVSIRDNSSAIVVAHDLETDANDRLFLPPGDAASFRVFFRHDSDADASLKAYSEIPKAVSLTTYDSASGNASIIVGVITLTHASSLTRENPYVITVRGSQLRHGVETAADVSLLFYTTDVDLADIVLAAEEDREAELGVYPNPFTDAIFVAGTKENELRLIITTAGSQVLVDRIVHAGETISLSHCAAGVYLFRIIGHRKMASGTIVRK